MRYDFPIVVVDNDEGRTWRGEGQYLPSGIFAGIATASFSVEDAPDDHPTYYIVEFLGFNAEELDLSNMEVGEPGVEFNGFSHPVGAMFAKAPRDYTIALDGEVQGVVSSYTIRGALSKWDTTNMTYEWLVVKVEKDIYVVESPDEAHRVTVTPS